MKFSALGRLAVLAATWQATVALPTRDAYVVEKRAPGCPGIPTGADPKALHVIRRLDLRPAVPSPWATQNMDGLMQLMQDTGGRHVDVLVGNAVECKRYDLRFDGNDYLNLVNADGAPIKADMRAYNDLGKDQQLDYKGHLPKEMTFDKVFNEMKQVIADFGTYNHQCRHCGAAADQLIAKLRPSTSPPPSRPGSPAPGSVPPSRPNSPPPSDNNKPGKPGKGGK